MSEQRHGCHNIAKDLCEIGELFCKTPCEHKPCDFCGQVGKFDCGCSKPCHKDKDHLGRKRDLEWAIQTCKNEFRISLCKHFK